MEVKTKKQNRLACEYDLSIALSETQPRIFQLVARKQQQKAQGYNNELICVTIKCSWFLVKCVRKSWIQRNRADQRRDTASEQRLETTALETEIEKIETNFHVAIRCDEQKIIQVNTN